MSDRFKSRHPSKKGRGEYICVSALIMMMPVCMCIHSAMAGSCVGACAKLQMQRPISASRNSRGRPVGRSGSSSSSTPLYFQVNVLNIFSIRCESTEMGEEEERQPTNSRRARVSSDVCTLTQSDFGLLTVGSGRVGPGLCMNRIMHKGSIITRSTAGSTT